MSRVGERLHHSFFPENVLFPLREYLCFEYTNQVNELSLI